MKPLLVYRLGHLGDTLIALPALWAVRQYFSDHRVTVLSENRPGRQVVTVREVLQGSGVCDDFLEYPVDDSLRGSLSRPWTMAVLFAKLRRRRFGTLVYLAPSRRFPRQIDRDRRFFMAAGIREVIGMDEYMGHANDVVCRHAEASPREADLLLARLSAAGIPVPPNGEGSMELGLGAAEEFRVNSWLSKQPDDCGKPWISVGLGAKQPVKRWPIARYEEVVSTLIDRFDVWPVVFGGPSDTSNADLVIKTWGRGYNAAAALDVRSALAAMKRCKLYLGNDTGTMHMAAAARIRCVGIFASHSPSGLWNPYGNGHTVLRTRVECEGCNLEECLERASECILSITVGQVIEACVATLATVSMTGPQPSSLRVVQ